MSYPGEDLGLPPVAAGFARYETHPVTVAPEQDVLWSEWVAPPIASDMDVVAVTGLQTKGGHHAILYATTDAQPVGTSRAWQDGDQLTARTVGGVGGRHAYDRRSIVRGPKGLSCPDVFESYA